MELHGIMFYVILAVLLGAAWLVFKFVKAILKIVLLVALIGAVVAFICFRFF